MSMEEDVEVIGRSKAVDLELDSQTGTDFTIEWWRDNERTVPINFTEVQMTVARLEGTPATLVVAAEDMAVDANTCRIRLSPPAIADALGVPTGEFDMKWFFQGTNASGVVMIVRGRAKHK